MIIKNIKLARLSVPLITPFKTAIRSVECIEDVVVIIETHCGAIGYGSAPSTPLITGDTHNSIIAAVTQLIAPKLIGRDIENLTENLAAIEHSIVGNVNAKAAVEIALYDLWGQYFKSPLYKLLGGGRSQLKTDVTISVNQIDKMVSDSLKAIDQGFDVLKIKIGKNINHDIERVKEIYSAVDNKAILRLDVNQGWTAKQTVFAVQQFEKQGIALELIEQPVKANDIAGLKFISERVNTPIMADESAFNCKQVLEIIKQNAADIINIKLMKTGGLSQALQICEIAKVFQVDCMIGCMLEGSIAVAAAAHLASAKSDVITKIDLDGPALGKYDPVKGGVKFNGSQITLAQSNGLGIKSIDGLQFI